MAAQIKQERVIMSLYEVCPLFNVQAMNERFVGRRRGLAYSPQLLLETGLLSVVLVALPGLSSEDGTIDRVYWRETGV